MTIDREQMRRDAEAIIDGEGRPSDEYGYDDELMQRAANAVLALLAELDKADALAEATRIYYDIHEDRDAEWDTPEQAQERTLSARALDDALTAWEADE